MNFEQFGRDLDKLSDIFNNVFKILDDVAFPSVKVDVESDNIHWKDAREIGPKVKCTKVTLNNIDNVVKFLLDGGRFDYAERHGTTIVTDWGEVEVGEWVIEDQHTITFASDDQFKKDYQLSKPD